MKKISILYFFSALLLITSCEDPETPDLGVDEQWLQFGRDTYSVAENAGGPIAVTVYYAGDSNPNDITVEYSVTSDDTDRYDLDPTTGTVVIPAGEFSADILIDPIDNFTSDGDAEIILELTSSNPEVDFGLAGEGVYSQATTVNIIDDDCPVDIQSFVGTWSVSEVFTSGTNEGLSLAAAYGETYQVEISLVPGDDTGTQLILNNSEGAHEYFVPGTVITLRPCSSSFEFNGGNPGIAAGAGVLNVQQTSFDDEAMRIVASGPLGNFGPYEFILTKVTE